jgi:cold shock CspA family protein
MTRKLERGTLKRWDDQRGFGFIAAEGRRDVFVHISAFKGISRRPAVGDVIVYQIGTDRVGRVNAVHAVVEGVDQPNRSVLGTARKRNNGNWFFRILPVALVILAGAIALSGLVPYVQLDDLIPGPATVHREDSGALVRYRCEGKVYCSQMRSCGEARFYLRNCPGTKMDGDHDGVPCESQWCGR